MTTITGDICQANAIEKSEILWFLEKKNATEVNITRKEYYLSIEAVLPNKNKIKINTGHTFYRYRTTITFKDFTTYFDPKDDELNSLVHFLI